MRLLWIGRAGGADDGGGIYDRRMLSCLRCTHEVQHIEAAPMGRLAQAIGAGLQAAAPETFRFGRAEDVESVVDAAREADALIFSHEHLDRLAMRVRARARAPKSAPFISIRHNVTSDLMAQVLPEPVAALWAAAARRQERQALAGNLFAGIAALSQRDRALIEWITGRRDVVLAMPGAPPASPLAENASVAPEVLLSGTYEWMPKAQDLRRFVREAPASPAWTALYADADLPDAAESLRAKSARDLDLSSAIRFGLITDRFAAGHKLKTAAYLMANCHVISYADVAEDFAFSPLAQRWIHRIRSASEIADVMQAAMAQPAEEARAQLQTIKAEVAAVLDWSVQAAAIELLVRRCLDGQIRL